MSFPSSQAPSSLSISSLMSETGAVLGARIVGAGLSFFVQVLFARWAGPDHYGTYSYVMAWTALLSTFSGFGFQQAILRFLPEYERSGQWGHVQGLVRRSRHIVAGVSILLTGVCIAFVVGMAPPRGNVSLYTVPLIVGFAFIPPRALSTLQTRMCVSRHQMRIAYVFPHLFRPLFMIGIAAVLVVGLGISLTATTAVLLAGTAVVPVWLVQRSLFRRQLPAEVKTAESVYESLHWLRTALPMLFVIGFSVILGQTDLLMIGLLSDPDQVGIYKVASKTASLVLFPLFAVKTVMSPRFAEQYSSENWEQLQRLASTAARWMFWGALSVGVALLVLSNFILGLFGPSFLQATPLLAILIGGQITNAGAGSVGPLLSMTDHQDESAMVYGTCALLNVVLNAIGITLFGLIGAALATATSTMLWNLGLYRVVTSELGIFPSILDTLRPTDRSSS